MAFLIPIEINDTAAAGSFSHVGLFDAASGANAAATALVEGAGATIAPTASTGTVVGWSIDVAADTTNGGVSVIANGIAATTINWSAGWGITTEATTAS